MPAPTNKTLFTDRMLKALKPAPPGKRNTCWDTVCAGLACRSTDKGTRSFYVVRNHAGKLLWVRLGRYPEMSLADARNAARATLGLLTEGQDPRPQRAERRRATQQQQQSKAPDKAPDEAKDESFAGIAERFIRHYENRNLRRGAEVVSLIRRELVTIWGDRNFAEIKHRDVLEAIEAIVDRSPYAARHAFAACQVLFGWAFARELIAVDPTARIKGKDLHGLDQSDLQRDRVLNNDELRVVWAAAEQTPYPFGPLVKLLILTGARLREISDATWDEIDIDAVTLTVPTTRMKGKVAHVIPLCSEALEIVQDLPRFTSGDFLFTTTSGQRPVSGFSKFKVRFDRTIAKLGEVAPFTIHDLRRTCRTGLAASGVSVFIAELVIGHIQKGVHGIYDRHRYQSEKHDALTLWEKRLQRIVQPAPEPAPNVVPIPVRT